MNRMEKLERNSAAGLAMCEYAKIKGDNQIQVRDLLADLMHYCDVQGINFDHELSMATDFYGDEG